MNAVLGGYAQSLNLGRQTATITAKVEYGISSRYDDVAL